MRETDKIRDKVVLVGLNSPVLKKHENADEESMEELADLLEVMMAVAEARGHGFAEVEAIRQSKAEKRGGFKARIFLESVTA